MSPRLAVVLATCALAAWACSSGGGAATGQEKGRCYANGSCNSGLTCFSNRCVRFDEGVVYWASGPSIYRAPITAASSGLSPIATTAHGGDVTSFFFDGATIYLAEDGFIELAHVGGAVAATPIAAGQAHPSSVRADGSNVYWTRADCAIENVRHE